MKLRTVAVLSATSALITGLVFAPSYPQWWLDQNVVASQAPAGPAESGYNAWMAENYAVANLGQAKNLAAAAYTTMDYAESGSAGTTIANMVSAFSTLPEDNYVPLTIGQLKALSAPFYNVMHAERLYGDLG